MKHPAPKESPAVAKAARGTERRQFPRIAASGSVEIVFSDPLPTTVHGELVDVSGQGLRIAHDSKLLVPGLIVSVTSEDRTSKARVVWTQLKDGAQISGCILL